MLKLITLLITSGLLEAYPQNSGGNDGADGGDAQNTANEQKEANMIVSIL